MRRSKPEKVRSESECMDEQEELSSPTESAAPEATTPSPSPVESHATDASGTDEAGSATVPESDDEEYEVTGEKYRVPKALAAHLKELQQGSLRQDDYTRKTQTVAEKARELETREQEITSRVQFQQKHIQDVAKVISIDERLAQFAQLDWNAIDAADPVQSVKLGRQMQELQQQRAFIVNGIEQQQQTQTQTQQQATARQRQESLAQLQREIKGFGSPELQKALIEVGQKSGYQAHELANISDPRAVRLLHKAHLYDQLVAKQTSEAKPKAAEVKPITRVQPGAGAVKKTLSDPGLSTEEYIRLRNETKRRR